MNAKNDCYKALQCLFLVVDEKVAQDVNDKVRAYINELETSKEDKEALDWLSQCTAGEWEELQNIRLANPKGYLREAIVKMKETK